MADIPAEAQTALPGVFRKPCRQLRKPRLAGEIFRPPLHIRRGLYRVGKAQIHSALKLQLAFLHADTQLIQTCPAQTEVKPCRDLIDEKRPAGRVDGEMVSAELTHKNLYRQTKGRPVRPEALPPVCPIRP